jgi:hypothetical protein
MQTGQERVINKELQFSYCAVCIPHIKKSLRNSLEVDGEEICEYTHKGEVYNYLRCDARVMRDATGGRTYRFSNDGRRMLLRQINNDENDRRQNCRASTLL